MTDTVQQNRALARLIEVIGFFRAEDELIPIQQVELLLHISRKPGIVAAELAEATNLAQASISRNCTAMAMVDRHGKPGKDWVSVEKDPEQPRRQAFYLTPKGRTLVKRVLTRIDEGVEFWAPTYREAMTASFRR
jgi:DNA-binding MarR family transcriptional regulator